MTTNRSSLTFTTGLLITFATLAAVLIATVAAQQVSTSQLLGSQDVSSSEEALSNSLFTTLTPAPSSDPSFAAFSFPDLPLTGAPPLSMNALASQSSSAVMAVPSWIASSYRTSAARAPSTSSLRPSSSRSPSLTSQSQASRSQAVLAHPCRPTDLTISSQLMRTGGAVIGRMVVRNERPTDCELAGFPTVQLRDSENSRFPATVRTSSDASAVQTVTPKGVAFFWLRWENWCETEAVRPYYLSVRFGSTNEYLLSPLLLTSGQPASAPACNDASALTQLTVGPFEQ